MHILKNSGLKRFKINIYFFEQMRVCEAKKKDLKGRNKRKNVKNVR